MLKEKKLGFIGGGQMCEAIFSGAVNSGAVSAGNIAITDTTQSRLDYLKEKYSVNVCLNHADGSGAKAVIEASDIIVLSVKPQFAREVLTSVKASFTAHKLVISIMGGVTLAFLQEFMPHTPVVRVMPNTPMMVRKGAAGIALGENAAVYHGELVQELFNSVGISFILPEKLIDPLTALSGCGPAFAYMFIEALADGGVEYGLPRALALQLAAQTLAGSAEMVLQTKQHPGELKDKVCSPGGGTIAGVHSLEKDAFRGSVINAVEASCQRMIEVGKKA
ncbi:MAG: pyrroline-5-carboxylate reductase [Oscillospiraceae bacterium]|nr:pyrroline-5-carboxylate reductase [Oscillospiraceae bacterium]